MVTITGVVRRVRFQGKGAWSILDVIVGQELYCAVGIAPGINEGDTCTFQGEWSTSAKWGKQFKFTEAIAAERSGIEAFLEMMPGVGPKRAAAIREKFGDTIWDVIEKSPGDLAEVAGITADRATEIAAEYAKRRAQRDFLVYARGAGISVYHAGLAWQKFEDKAHAVVRTQPYRLIEAAGVGFLTADKIARKVGVPADSRERARAALRYVMAQIEETEGSTLVDGGVIMAALRGLERGPGGKAPPVSLEPPVTEEGAYGAIKDLRAEGQICLDGRLVQLTTTRNEEAEIAKRLAEICLSPAEEPPPAPWRAAEGKNQFDDDPFSDGDGDGLGGFSSVSEDDF